MTNDRKYTSETLRERLGETLDALLDKKNPMDLERAKAVAGVAQTMINVAKVEIDFMKVNGGEGTGFIVEKSSPSPALAAIMQIQHGSKGDSSDSQPEDDDEDITERVEPSHSGGSTYRSSGGVTVHRGSKY